MKKSSEAPRASHQELLEKLGSLRRALRLVWEASKVWTILMAALVVLQGLLPVALVYLTKLVVDALTFVMGAGLSADTFKYLAVPVALMGGVLLLQELLQSAAQWLRTAQAELVKDHINGLVHRKAYSIDVSFFESSGNFDNLQRARQSSARSLQVLEQVGSLVRSFVALVGISGVLLPYGMLVPVLLLISMIPALVIVLVYQQKQYQWWRQRTSRERRAAYYDTLLTSYEPAVPEIRLFDSGADLASAYQHLRSGLRTELLQLTKSHALARLAAAGFALLVTGGIMIWMVIQVVNGAATLGDVALFYQAFHQGQGLMRTLLDSGGQIYSNAFYLRHLFDFLDMQPRVTSPAAPVPIFRNLEKGIRFRDVSFRYPGTREPVLEHFDLYLPAGRTVALVGPNGSGKSTLIKLICRFYDPSEGTVTFDGVDVRDFDVEELQSKITVMFQFPAHYQDTAAKNIEVASRKHSGDVERVLQASRQAGADEVITGLPDGYETPLGRWFKNGVQLSGGEWQRVALARAFFRDAPIVLLDEPTSFMDSWAETAWLHRFSRMVRGRTALIITHRFTTAMRADFIYLMDRGQIIEQGTHAEMLDLGGEYARSWREQVNGAEATVHSSP